MSKGGECINDVLSEPVMRVVAMVINAEQPMREPLGPVPGVEHRQLKREVVVVAGKR